MYKLEKERITMSNPDYDIPHFGKRQFGESNGMWGKEHTDETKAKMSAVRKGVKKPEAHAQKLRQNIMDRFAIEVVTPLGTFESHAEAAKAHGIARSTMTRRLDNDNFPDFYAKKT